MKAFKKYFPMAMTGPEVEARVYQKLSSLGMNPTNTVWTQSSCPDELNHDNYSQDLSQLMGNRWGEVFHLGGLAGIPFTGKTGWGAFAHHIPVDGNILVLFAPHVGVTTDGTVGKVHRPGQDHATSACGAAVGAYSLLKKDSTAGDNGPDASGNDYQMQYIINAMSSRMDAILALTDPNEQ